MKPCWQCSRLWDYIDETSPSLFCQECRGVKILEAIDEGYLCFCGKFNTDDDMCNHSPDDEEEWREQE